MTTIIFYGESFLRRHSNEFNDDDEIDHAIDDVDVLADLSSAIDAPMVIAARMTVFSDSSLTLSLTLSSDAQSVVDWCDKHVLHTALLADACHAIGARSRVALGGVRFYAYCHKDQIDSGSGVVESADIDALPALVRRTVRALCDEPRVRAQASAYLQKPGFVVEVSPPHSSCEVLTVFDLRWSCGTLRQCARRLLAGVDLPSSERFSSTDGSLATTTGTLSCFGAGECRV
jgi:hypothetical protein